jgi:hypothetical protein
MKTLEGKVQNGGIVFSEPLELPDGAEVRVNIEEKNGTPPKEGKSPLWKTLEDIHQNMPDEEKNKLPTDGAAQHDHYVYGAPKREQ